MYSQAMIMADGAKDGTTQMMTINDARKLRTPDKAARNEFWSAPSTVFMSAVHRFNIRPMGVTSKKRVGAAVKRVSIALNNEREALRIE